MRVRPRRESARNGVFGGGRRVSVFGSQDAHRIFQIGLGAVTDETERDHLERALDGEDRSPDQIRLRTWEEMLGAPLLQSLLLVFMLILLLTLIPMLMLSPLSLPLLPPRPLPARGRA